MAQATHIQWTDASSNPLKYRDKVTGKDVWACVKLSSGCAHCYAETLAKRFGRGGPFTRSEMDKVEPYLCEKELKRLLTSKPLAGKKVFLCDMTDVFGEWVPDAMLDKLFAVMALRSDVTFQILTKRAERMQKYLSQAYMPGAICDVAQKAGTSLVSTEYKEHSEGVYTVMKGPKWPLPNVWLGTSCENQAAADERIPHLLATPAAVRFLSCEPLLGEVDLSEWMYTIRVEHNGDGDNEEVPCKPDIHWVIVGAESGSGARPFAYEWARSLRDQCKAAGVAFFLKQVGPSPCTKAPSHGDSGLLLTRVSDVVLTNRPKDKKGGEPTEWPVDLRVRQFPDATK